LISKTTIIYVHVNIILDLPITYNNAAVLCQSECACLHKTVNMVVFFEKSKENTYPEGEHSCKCTDLSLKRIECITCQSFLERLQEKAGYWRPDEGRGKVYR